MIVVDASVAMKWFAPEPDEAAARAVLQSDRELMAPALARVEVAAALIRKGLRREMPLSAAKAALDLWRRTLDTDRVVLVPDGVDLEAGCRLAMALDHPLPDCLYLALAARLGAPLMTADRKFAGRAAGCHEAIHILGEGGLPTTTT